MGLWDRRNYEEYYYYTIVKKAFEEWAWAKRMQVEVGTDTYYCQPATEADLMEVIK
jgi:hypothetical protein